MALALAGYGYGYGSGAYGGYGGYGAGYGGYGAGYGGYGAARGYGYGYGAGAYGGYGSGYGGYGAGYGSAYGGYGGYSSSSSFFCSSCALFCVFFFVDLRLRCSPRDASQSTHPSSESPVRYFPPVKHPSCHFQLADIHTQLTSLPARLAKEAKTPLALKPLFMRPPLRPSAPDSARLLLSSSSS